MKKIRSRFSVAMCRYVAARNYEAKAKSTQNADEKLYYLSQAHGLREEQHRHIIAGVLNGDPFATN